MKNENISDILARRLNHMGLGNAVVASRVCAEADKVSEDEFTSISFKNGTLKIHVSSGARAHMIKLREKEIISKINLKLKKDLVLRLSFEIG